MKKKIIIVSSRVFALLFLVFSSTPVLARKQIVDKITPGIGSLGEFVMAVLNIFIKIGVPMASIFLIWSGYLFVSAQGNESKLTTAKHTFVWTCVGTAVLFGSWVLAKSIEGTINALVK